MVESADEGLVDDQLQGDDAGPYAADSVVQETTKHLPFDSRSGDESGRLMPCIQALLHAQCRDFDEVCRVLRVCVDKPSREISPEERRLMRLVRHMLFLLDDGETLFAGCEFRQDSRMNSVLEVQRVFCHEASLGKVFVKIAAVSLPSDPSAFQEYTAGPSIMVYTNPLRVFDAFGQTDNDLSQGELRELLNNRQKLKDGIRVRRGELGRPFEMLMRQQIEGDIDQVRLAFEACLVRLPNVDVPITRDSHPYRGPQLLILPRLIRAPEGRSVLAFIADNLPLILSYGFVGIMLGPVDKQSTQVYYGETPGGKLVAHINNHGYWCSGEVGIDPMLGTEEDYRSLIARAAELGMSYTQDCTFATLGYLPQVGRLASTAETTLSTTMFKVGGKRIELCDPGVFMHEVGVLEEDGLDERVSSAHYAAVLYRMYVGSSFDLPRPNLYVSEVREAVMERSLWQVREGHVGSFRIDMAKHLGVSPLRNVLRDLRSEVVRLHTSSPRTMPTFSAVLEYWTLNYRDLRFASLILGQERAGVYLYDFPLANAIQDIFLKKYGFYATVKRLLCERDRWMIDLRQLIPTFIDHDFHFKPIYNGSRLTSAIVVAGYAMCLMLSANAPCVYFGYQNAEAGVPDAEDYFAYSEQFSRKAVEEVFASNDQCSPARPLAALFTRINERGALEQWEGSTIEIHGDDYQLTISRAYRDRLTGERNIICARFSRFEGDADVPNRPCDVLFHHVDGPSSLVWTYSEEDDQRHS